MNKNTVPIELWLHLQYTLSHVELYSTNTAENCLCSTEEAIVCIQFDHELLIVRFVVFYLKY